MPADNTVCERSEETSVITAHDVELRVGVRVLLERASFRIAPGDRIARVPKSSGRIAARYRLLHGPAKGLSFGAGVTAFSARELTLPNSIAVPGYAVIDAQASYDIGRFSLGISVVNLGGRRAWDPHSYMGYPVVAPNQPRSAYATLKVRM